MPVGNRHSYVLLNSSMHICENFLWFLQEKLVIGIAYDCTEKMVYWTDISTPAISKANLQGGEPIHLIKSGSFRLVLMSFQTCMIHRLQKSVFLYNKSDINFDFMGHWLKSSQTRGGRYFRNIISHFFQVGSQSTIFFMLVFKNSCFFASYWAVHCGTCFRQGIRNKKGNCDILTQNSDIFLAMASLCLANKLIFTI